GSDTHCEKYHMNPKVVGTLREMANETCTFTYRTTTPVRFRAKVILSDGSGEMNKNEAETLKMYSPPTNEFSSSVIAWIDSGRGFLGVYKVSDCISLEGVRWFQYVLTVKEQGSYDPSP
ncbi:hypothetical protein KI387_004199, partial [Taxus chinensis]